MYGSSLNSSYYTIMQPFGLLYSTASQATYIIENIDKVEFFDQKLKSAYLGEAYFWRAFSHFYLLTNYRKVALIKHARKVWRTTCASCRLDEIWDFIAEDLLLAKENLLKRLLEGDQAGRVTAAAAAALRGKAYLFRSGIEPLYGKAPTHTTTRLPPNSTK